MQTTLISVIWAGGTGGGPVGPFVGTGEIVISPDRPTLAANQRYSAKAGDEPAIEARQRYTGKAGNRTSVAARRGKDRLGRDG